jgi:hypothetical protein
MAFNFNIRPNTDKKSNHLEINNPKRNYDFIKPKEKNKNSEDIKHFGIKKVNVYDN